MRYIHRGRSIDSLSLGGIKINHYDRSWYNFFSSYTYKKFILLICKFVCTFIAIITTFTMGMIFITNPFKASSSVLDTIFQPPKKIFLFGITNILCFILPNHIIFLFKNFLIQNYYAFTLTPSQEKTLKYALVFFLISLTLLLQFKFFLLKLIDSMYMLLILSCLITIKFLSYLMLDTLSKYGFFSTQSYYLLFIYVRQLLITLGSLYLITRWIILTVIILGIFMIISSIFTLFLNLFYINLTIIHREEIILNTKFFNKSDNSLSQGLLSIKIFSRQVIFTILLEDSLSFIIRLITIIFSVDKYVGRQQLLFISFCIINTIGFIKIFIELSFFLNKINTLYKYDIYLKNNVLNILYYIALIMFCGCLNSLLFIIDTVSLIIPIWNRYYPLHLGQQIIIDLVYNLYQHVSLYVYA